MKINIAFVFSFFFLLSCATYEAHYWKQSVPEFIDLGKKGTEKEQSWAIGALERYLSEPRDDKDLVLKAREFLSSKRVCSNHLTRKRPTPPAVLNTSYNILYMYPSWCNECFADIPHGEMTNRCESCDYDRCENCNQKKVWKNEGDIFSSQEIRILKLEWEVKRLQAKQDAMIRQKETEDFMRGVQHYQRMFEANL